MALPMNPKLWFCWMLISMFGPPAALFCFCVIAPEPEAFDMIDWSCVSGLPSQAPPLVAFLTVLPPKFESCLIEID